MKRNSYLRIMLIAGLAITIGTIGSIAASFFSNVLSPTPKDFTFNPSFIGLIIVALLAGVGIIISIYAYFVLPARPKSATELLTHDNNVNPNFNEGTRDLQRQKEELELKLRQLDLEQKRLELQRIKLELEQSRYEFAIDTARKIIDQTDPEAHGAEKTQLVTLLLPQLLRLQGIEGLELVRTEENNTPLTEE